MKVTTTIADLVSELPELYQERHAIHLLGAPGCGKSDVLRNAIAAICSANGIDPADFRVLTVNLTSVDSLDVRGIPVPVKRPTGASAVFTKSPIFEMIMATGCAHGILLLDEFAQADPMTQKASASVILDRTLGEDTIPDGWWVALTSNRQQDKSGAAKMMRHLDNRLVTYNVENNVDSLLKWWAANDKHPLGAGFIEFRPDAVFTDSVPAEPGPFCTPRSYARLWEKIERRGIDNLKHMFATSAGMIGEAAAIQLQAYIEVAVLLPTLDQMKANPKGCPMPPRDRRDAQYALAASLVYYADVDAMSWVWPLAERLNPEFATSIATRCVEKVGPRLINDPQMARWIARNPGLIGNS